MRKVAAYLGLSKSALYHYFPTKEHLFLACTRQVMGGLDRTFIDATASDEENLAQLKMPMMRASRTVLFYASVSRPSAAVG